MSQCIKCPDNPAHLACRYELPGLRAASLKVVIATMDIANVCHNVLLGHDLKYAELSQVRA